MKGRNLCLPEIAGILVLAFSSSAILLVDTQYSLGTLLLICSVSSAFYMNGDAKRLAAIILPLLATTSLCSITTGPHFACLSRGSLKCQALLASMIIISFLQLFHRFEGIALKSLAVIWCIAAVMNRFFSESRLDGVSLLGTAFLVIFASISRRIFCKLVSRRAKIQTTDLQTLQAEITFLCNIAPLVFLHLDQFRRGSISRGSDPVCLAITAASVTLTLKTWRPCWNFQTWGAHIARSLSPLVCVEMLHFGLPYAIDSLKMHVHDHFTAYILSIKFFGLSIVYLLCVCVVEATDFQTCHTRKTGQSRKRVVTLRRKGFHFLLIAFTILVQKEEKFHFDFERFVFPMGIAVCLLSEVYLCLSADGSQLLQRLRSYIAKPEEGLFVRSHLYLLLGSILPAFLLKVPSASVNTEFDYSSLNDYILGRLFFFSGFVCVGVTDAFAAVVGIIFGHTRIGRITTGTSKISSKTWEGIFAAYVSTFFVLLYAYLELTLTVSSSQTLFTGRDRLDFVHFLHGLSFSCACCESILEIDDNIALPVVMVILWSIWQRTFLVNMS